MKRDYYLNVIDVDCRKIMHIQNKIIIIKNVKYLLTLKNKRLVR